MESGSETLTMDLVDAVDHVTVLSPPGWRCVMIRRGVVERGLVVARVEAVSVEADHAALPAGLGLDLALRRGFLGETFDSIHEQLQSRRIVWDGLTVRLRRSGCDDGAAIALELLTPFGQPVAKIGLERPGPYRVLTTALGDVFERESAVWAERRAELEVQFGASPKWRFVHEDSETIVEGQGGPAAVLPSQVLGSWSADESRWSWSWADLAFPAHQTERVADLRDRSGSEPGLGLLRRPSFRCELAFARVVAQMAAHRLDAVSLERPVLDRPDLVLFYAAALTLPGDSRAIH